MFSSSRALGELRALSSQGKADGSAQHCLALPSLQACPWGLQDKSLGELGLGCEWSAQSGERKETGDEG